VILHSRAAADCGIIRAFSVYGSNEPPEDMNAGSHKTLARAFEGLCPCAHSLPFIGAGFTMEVTNHD